MSHPFMSVAPLARLFNGSIAVGVAITTVMGALGCSSTRPAGSSGTAGAGDAPGAGSGGLAGLGAGISGAGPAVGDAGGANPVGAGGSRAEGGTGGVAGIGGSAGSSTNAGASGVGSGGAGAPSCGAAELNENPFGCSFAWGTSSVGQNAAPYGYLQFLTQWVGSEVRQDGSLTSCSGCNWLTRSVAATNLVPVYYAYMIGFYGHANGLPDGNVGGPPNLTTGGAELIRNNRAKIVEMYAGYARQSYAVWKTKPLVWLLEGDFIQYAGASQMNPLSYAELGLLAADITCAIKSNMPNAVVAINHSSWNANNATNSFWGAMKQANFDLVWTSGAANANGFFTAGTTSTSYNGATATYAYVHALTGKSLFVDTSFGASAADDTWSNSTSATLNQRIAEGVIAANVVTVPSNYATAIAALVPSLSATCP